MEYPATFASIEPVKLDHLSNLLNEKSPSIVEGLSRLMNRLTDVGEFLSLSTAKDAIAEPEIVPVITHF